MADGIVYTENDMWDLWGSPKQKAIIKQLLRDSAGVGIFTENVKSIAIYSIKYFGAKCDGVTDDTEALRRAGRELSNIRVVFPENSTTIISDKIDLIQEGVVFVGQTGSKIKLKDNSGLLNKVISGQYTKIPDLIGCFRKGCGVENLELDGNVYNNYVMNGTDKWSVFFTANLIPNQPYSGGYGGIGLSHDNTFARNCYIHDFSWGGVDAKEFDENNVSSPVLHVNQIIEYNRIENCGRDCISLHNCKGAIVRKNNIKRHHWHAIHDYVNNSDNIIEDNILIADNANRVAMYPGHLTEFPTLDAILIDHNNYRDSEVKNTCVRGNVIDGYNTGINPVGYATSYKIYDNEIINTTSGIIVGFSLGKCFVERNKINNATRGIAVALVVTGSTTAMYPTYTSDLQFTLNITNNIIDNCTEGHVRVSIKKTNDNNVDILNSHLTKCFINIKKNDFLSSSTKPPYCVTFGYMDAQDKAIINIANNNGNNSYTSSFQQSLASNYVSLLDNTTGVIVPPSIVIKGGASITRVSSDPLSSYTASTVEYYEVGAGSATGFPNNAAGILITYRGINDIYNYQEYHIRQGVSVYKRYWDTTGNVWTTWQKISAV